MYLFGCVRLLSLWVELLSFPSHWMWYQKLHGGISSNMAQNFQEHSEDERLTCKPILMCFVGWLFLQIPNGRKLCNFTSKWPVVLVSYSIIIFCHSQDSPPIFQSCYGQFTAVYSSLYFVPIGPCFHDSTLIILRNKLLKFCFVFLIQTFHSMHVRFIMDTLPAFMMSVHRSHSSERHNSETP